jgi:hypothetical protein
MKLKVCEEFLKFSQIFQIYRKTRTNYVLTWITHYYASLKSLAKKHSCLHKHNQAQKTIEKIILLCMNTTKLFS